MLRGGFSMKKKGFILPLALIAGMLVGCDTGNSNNGSNNYSSYTNTIKSRI